MAETQTLPVSTMTKVKIRLESGIHQLQRAVAVVDHLGQILKTPLPPPCEIKCERLPARFEDSGVIRVGSLSDK